MRPFLIPVLSAVLLASAALSQEGEVDLPETAPVPQELPARASEPETPPQDEAEDAAEPQSGEEAGEQLTGDDQQLPEDQAAPLPSARPAPPAASAPTRETADEPASGEPRAARRSTAMLAEEIACRARLRELGVDFEEHPPQSEPEGCEMAHPITVSSLGAGVALEPGAVINCATAEANARLMRDHAQAQATRHLSSRIATVNQVSGYVCRPRNGTRKLSEHAFGNALDWGAIVLEDERRLDVRAYRRGSPEATFFAALRKAACGPFTTVLGPGTDADHADHFHFDLAERSNGSTYCR